MEKKLMLFVTFTKDELNSRIDIVAALISEGWKVIENKTIYNESTSEVEKIELYLTRVFKTEPKSSQP